MRWPDRRTLVPDENPVKTDHVPTRNVHTVVTGPLGSHVNQEFEHGRTKCATCRARARRF